MKNTIRPLTTLLVGALSLVACGGRQTCPTIDEDALAARIVARLMAAEADEVGEDDDVEDDGPRVTLPPREGAPAQGPASARVTITVFSDFECPFCGRLLPTFERIRDSYGDDVRIVFRNYPLPFHRNARIAAEAALEVQAQLGDEAFFRFHDALFESQRSLDRESLEQLASAVPGLDMARFRRALDQGTHRPTIEADISAANEAIGSMGTPTSVINRSLVIGAQPYEAFREVIDRELGRTR